MLHAPLRRARAFHAASSSAKAPADRTISAAPARNGAGPNARTFVRSRLDHHLGLHYKKRIDPPTKGTPNSRGQRLAARCVVTTDDSDDLDPAQIARSNVLEHKRAIVPPPMIPTAWFLLSCVDSATTTATPQMRAWTPPEDRPGRQGAKKTRDPRLLLSVLCGSWARLVAMETLVPGPGEMHPFHVRFARRGEVSVGSADKMEQPRPCRRREHVFER